jgi:5-methyltetrahydropteroyltriglutamate--homocysteine methyltransferase
MHRSVDRILTTHVGSLPRPPDLLAMIAARQNGVPVDTQAFDERVRSAVADAVRRQVEVGIDVVNDGEMGRYGFIPYINDRLGGFKPDPEEDGSNYWEASREGRAFPEFYAWVSKQPGSAASVTRERWNCCGPIHYKGQKAIATDIANLRHGLNGVTYADAFMPAISPANVEQWQRNRYYADGGEYLHAIADALREEYKAIVDAGFVVQIDEPALASYYLYNPDASIAEFRRWAEERVEVLNNALRDIPEEKVRYHTCYGINMGPRATDLELKHFIDILLKIRAGAYSFEASNPRHEHEWQEWKNIKVPEGKILMPGVVTQSSVLVEHPELVAERIVRYANIVGPQNVIASTDCGFASFATSNEIHETIVWAKLKALTEGARIASRKLWS